MISHRGTLPSKNRNWMGTSSAFWAMKMATAMTMIPATTSPADCRDARLLFDDPVLVVRHVPLRSSRSA